MKKYIKYPICWAILLMLMSCENFLDEKPDQKLAIPTTLADLQALLNEHDLMNHQIPNLGEIGSGNFFLTDTDWAGLSLEERNIYTWNRANLFPPEFNDWSMNFAPVYVANVVLETMPSITRDAANSRNWDYVKGQALYYRAHNFLQAAYVWAPAYDAATAATDLGIPLRLSSDFNIRSERASVEETYAQILLDLKEAATLLPVTQSHPIRPYKASAYALLARTYLSMRQYEQAKFYADSTLQLQPALLDYNTLNPAETFPFPRFNPEVLTEHLAWGVTSLLREDRAKVDPILYASYAADDLRKEAFFRDNGDGSFAFKGSYGHDSPFAGPATDEMYLTRAEGYARTGNVSEAMRDLNTLLVKRWRSGTFIPLEAGNQQEALALILQERRKQLLQRSLWWMDIKRLNKEGANITLTRTVQGQTYTLPPNDLRYALPIPDDVIAISGMPQNPR
ncbi:RagB/SusD family nutrient uptake outer membrane protein [Pontibacter indicus]|uniref:Starch-binding associating with outer membrane n=1 Tax=Pontibacter indicus TaxID=1317125 RepID=A0A1R3XR10_9BACT|nr:RagB/SusD family nutrient uptake outer membrane protein [Pontibacter indicus]SIT94055.1 Starch-binding associating with outer membrane [Pontibacter indicus]